MARRLRLGEILVSRGDLTEQQLSDALEQQKIRRMRLGEVLIDMKLITEENLLEVLSEQLNLPVAEESDYKKIKVDVELASRVMLPLMQSKRFLPVKLEGDGKITVLCNDSNDEEIAEICRKVYKAAPLFILTKKDFLLRKLADYKIEADRAETRNKVSGAVFTPIAIYDLNAESKVGTVREANYILLNAFRCRASDIHLKPEETVTHLQYRIDGVLHLMDTYPNQYAAPLINRLKNMSSIQDMGGRRSQDGGFQAIADGKDVDMRLSTMPTIYGEKVVIRLLDRAYINSMTIDNLGLSEHNKNLLIPMIKSPNGIFVVTGPMGSGKSTTTHACIQLLNDGTISISSIENPVEHKAIGVAATEINERAGLTFASALRGVLRQDVDKVYLGEIRDAETAAIAFRAAQQGHFIFSTLHTNSAVGAIPRLMDLEVRTYQMLSALRGVMAQVLVRKICPHCGGDGCDECMYTGYYGRVPLHEILVFTPKVRAALEAGKSLQDVEKIARSENLIPIYEDGIAKVKQGITTMAEVERAARAAEEYV